jgi:hypothetical protein
MSSSNSEEKRNLSKGEKMTKDICKIVALLCCVSLMACGKKDNWLKGVNVVSAEQNGETTLSVKAYLNTGDIPLPAVDLPVPNPADANDIWGRVAIRPMIGDTLAELEVTGNLTRLPSTSNCASNDTLPNGLKIPVVVDPATLICLNVANSAATVYLAANLAAKTLMIGTAVPIKQFDDLVDKLPDANAFLKFTFNNITGNFGAFTGAQAGQNGLGFFVDASKVLGGALSPKAFQETISIKKAMVLQRKFEEIRKSGKPIELH